MIYDFLFNKWTAGWMNMLMAGDGSTPRTIRIWAWIKILHMHNWVHRADGHFRG